MIGLAVSIVMPLAIGLALVVAAAPRLWRDWRGRVLSLGLAIGIGLGVASCVFYLVRLVAGAPAILAFMIEVAIVIAAGRLALGKLRIEARTPSSFPNPEGSSRPVLERILALAFGVVAVTYVITYVSITSQNHHGRWDAWAIWNLRARFLYAGGDHWSDAFAPVLAWSNNDYPLLLPLSVARQWTWIGDETWLAPASLGLLFGLSLVCVATMGVWRLRGKLHGLMAGTVLLSSPVLVEFSAAQCADAPLGCFILVTLVLLALADTQVDHATPLLVLSGVAAGLCAWTKNEGMAFAVILLAARVGTAVWHMPARDAWRETRAFLFGLVPVMAIVAQFKLRHTSGSFMLSSILSPAAMAQLADPEHWLEGSWRFARGVLQFEDGWPLLLLVIGLFWGLRLPPSARRSVQVASVAVIALLGAYFAFFILSPYGFDWFLDTTLDRLLLHIWPATVFIVFVSIGDLGRIAPGRARIEH